MPGFVVTTGAYDAATAPIRDRILELAADPDHDRASERIRRLVMDTPMPEAIAEAVGAATEELGGEVAVRSSATAEDLDDASFAGQQDTYLNLTGADRVRDAVRRCWASLWTPRALDYRARQRIPADEVSLAVVVQRMVDASAAGVMFTADPATGRRDTCLVSAAWGLGEAVVSGQVGTDDLVVVDGTVTSRHTADKQHRTVRTDDGTELVAVPDELRRAEVLTDAEAVALAGLGRRAEAHFGHPQDLEWVRGDTDDDHQLWIVQSRPITALPAAAAPPPTDWPVPAKGLMYIRASIVEQLPDPLSPLFADLAAEAVPTGLRRMLTAWTGREEVVDPAGMTFPTVNGYAYYGYSAKAFAQMTALAPSLVAVLAGRPGRVGPEHWRTVGHPAYRSTVRRLTPADPSSLSTCELLDRARELLLAGCEYYAVVQSVLPPVAAAEVVFSRFHRAFVARDGAAPAETFMLGSESAPIRAEKSLYALAQWVREDPDLVAAVLEPVDPDGAVPDGVDAAVWQEFTVRLRDHLDAHGHSVFNLDIMQPVAADHPVLVLDSLRFHLRGDGQDPAARQERLRAARRAAIEEVHGRVHGWRRRRFDQLLERAWRLAPMREDALADVGLAWPVVRGLLRVAGERLVAAGALDAPDQVYWLRWAELRDAADRLDREGADVALSDVTAEVADRQQVWRGQRLVSPPPMLPEDSALHLFDSMMPSASNTQSGPTINGIAASGGTVTARARVLRGPEEFGSMQPGEVLVAAITTPAWTPLFAQASAVVTDIGGPLSHSSIVAREYGIPAVLGTGAATTRIRTGDLITVDGATGTVSWVDDGTDAAARADHGRDDEPADHGRGPRWATSALVAAAAAGLGIAAVTAVVVRRRRR